MTIYTHSPQDLDQKNGSVNLVQSENDMIILALLKSIYAYTKTNNVRTPWKRKKFLFHSYVDLKENNTFTSRGVIILNKIRM